MEGTGKIWGPGFTGRPLSEMSYEEIEKARMEELEREQAYGKMRGTMRIAMEDRFREHETEFGYWERNGITTRDRDIYMQGAEDMRVEMKRRLDWIMNFLISMKDGNGNPYFSIDFVKEKYIDRL